LKPLATPLSNTNKPISYYHCMLTMNWRHEEQNTVVNPLTCRCSNGSPRPHRCCSVANKVENIDRRQVWVCPTITRPRKKLPFLWGIPAPRITPQTELHLDRFSRSAVFVLASDRQMHAERHTDRPRHTCYNRPHLMLVLQSTGLNWKHEQEFCMKCTAI